MICLESAPPTWHPAALNALQSAMSHRCVLLRSHPALPCHHRNASPRWEQWQTGYPEFAQVRSFIWLLPRVCLREVSAVRRCPCRSQRHLSCRVTGRRVEPDGPASLCSAPSAAAIASYAGSHEGLDEDIDLFCGYMRHAFWIGHWHRPNGTLPERGGHERAQSPDTQIRHSRRFNRWLSNSMPWTSR